MRSISVLPLLLSTLHVQTQAQQSTTATFTLAVQITTTTENSGSPAVPAQCPAHAPISCSSIGASDWCCPSGNTCGWDGGSVGCCPQGESCASYGGDGGSQWQPTTSYWQPPTTTWQTWNSWAPQTVTVTAQQYPAAAPQVVTTQAQPYPHGGQVQGNGYCSTVFEKGPGLPTEAQGQCGTILVLEAEARRNLDGWMVVRLGMGAVVVQVVAGLLLWVR